MLEQLPHDKVAALNVTIFSSTSLAVMMADYVWLLRDEIKYIWSWSVLRSSWKANVFMATRYMGLLSQIFNVYFSVRMYLGVYTPPAGCRFWFAFQASVVQIHLVFLELLLMHRVYCLFFRSRTILLTLVALYLGQIASMIVSAKLAFPSNRFTTSCVVVGSNPRVAFFSTATLATNLIILLMMFWRYLRLPGRWMHAGLGRIVVRDSALSLGAISVTMLFLTLLSFRVIDPGSSSNTTYYWLVCILWVSVGRIIINHERLQRQMETDEKEESDIWGWTVQLTSMIEMGKSTVMVQSQIHGPSSAPDDHSHDLPTIKESQIPSSSAYASDGAVKALEGCRDTEAQPEPK